MEPHSTVCNPPILSDSQPQNWRARNADPSSTDSMAAPWPGLMPRSPQSATTCPIGMDMVMQQQKMAADSATMAHSGCMPATRVPLAGP